MADHSPRSELKIQTKDLTKLTERYFLIKEYKVAFEKCLEGVFRLFYMVTKQLPPATSFVE